MDKSQFSSKHYTEPKQLRKKTTFNMIPLTKIL